MKRNVLILFAVVFLAVFYTSCKKDPGSGGTSSIYGKVFAKDYNSTFTVLLESYYAQDYDVYLIYGDDKTYGDKVKTSYDGTFEFKYLRKGTYHVYAYSKDSTLLTNAMIPVIEDVEITKNNEDVETPEIVIFK
jgi:hypothetical protein